MRFSPPVSREVTSADVKYAIERGFFNTVNNGYAGAYFGDLVGAEPGAKPGTEIEGIRTPDDRTIVFKLSRGSGGVLAGALALPLSAPVPADYAAKFDKANPSSYGMNQVATGPYMIENDTSGKAIGYEAGRRIHLVRNPNWDAATDYKPAYVDEIEMPQGNDDTTVSSRKILEGDGMLTGDCSAPPAVLAQVVKRQKDQLALVPSGSARYVSMNTTIKPFDDVNVRRAVVAGFNREALRLVRGGELLGDIPTHMIPPGMPGFEESGGYDGFGLDFMSHPGGDPALAAEYMKKAGYASGKYEGDEELLMVGTTEGVAQKTAEVAKENFEQLGFKVRLRLVTQDAMYTKFCNVPTADVAICPNVSWGKDFGDAQTILDPTFNGDNIIPQMNSNWPRARRAGDQRGDGRGGRAVRIPKERAQAWARINRMITEQAPVVSWIWDKQTAAALGRRQRRGQRVQLAVGLGMDLAEVGPEAAAAGEAPRLSRCAAAPPRRRRRASRPPGGRSPGRGRSRAAGATRPSGRSGRTRTGGRRRRCPGPRRAPPARRRPPRRGRCRRPGSTCARCRAGW